MYCKKENFPEAAYLPLTREEMKSLINGTGTPRPAIACGHWLHIDELGVEKQPVIEQLLKKYPEDMQVFYLKKPSLFGKPGDTYTWCDVPDADPSLHRTGTVGIDEESAISWDVFRQISDHVPNAEEPTMYVNAPKEDGRYRMVWFSNGPWGRLWDYRGMTNAMMDLYTNPEEIHKINRKVTDFFKVATKRGVEEAHIDAIAFGDDLGMQKGPFMSPEMFREFYFPYYKEICDYAHSLGLHVWLHCCGDARLLIPQFIEAGLDVLHPIQKYAMDEQEIVDTFKDDLTFWAGMDLQRILPFGTVEEVKQEARHFIDVFHQPKKGKMIFTLNNRIQDNVPLENFVAFIEEAYRYADEVGKKDRGE